VIEAEFLTRIALPNEFLYQYFGSAGSVALPMTVPFETTTVHSALKGHFCVPFKVELLVCMQRKRVEEN
jgi:hypothetical protein